MSPEERQQNYRELVHRSNTELKKMPYANRSAMQQKVNEALAAVEEELTDDTLTSLHNKRAAGSRTP